MFTTTQQDLLTALLDTARVSANTKSDQPEISSDPELELEVRFGSFVKDKSLKNGFRFDPGNDKNTFMNVREKLMRSMKKSGKSKSSQILAEPSLVIYSSSNVRTVIEFEKIVIPTTTTKGKERSSTLTVTDTYKERKEKIGNVDNSDFDFRIGVALEQRFEANAFDDGDANPNYLYRYRLRESFMLDDLWRVDMTRIVSKTIVSNGLFENWFGELANNPIPAAQDVSRYEIEVELVDKSMLQELMSDSENQTIGTLVSELVKVVSKLNGIRGTKSSGLTNQTQIVVFEQIHDTMINSRSLTGGNHKVQSNQSTDSVDSVGVDQTLTSKLAASWLLRGIETGAKLTFDMLTIKPLTFHFKEYGMIQSAPENYALTEKADGEHFCLWYHEKNGVILGINSRNVIFPTNVRVRKNSKSKIGESFLLIAEYMADLKTMLIFDCIVAKGTDISDANLKERLDYAQQIVGTDALKFFDKNNIGTVISGPVANLLDDLDSIGLEPIRLKKIRNKQFVWPGVADKKGNIMSLRQAFKKIWIDTEYDYEVDGIIYTPTNRDYRAKPYKWKSLVQQTIDMLVKFRDLKQGIAFVSISRYDFKRNHMEHGVYYRRFFGDLANKTNYFPVEFKLGHDLNPEGYETNLVTSSKSVELEDDKIYEFMWDADKKSFVPIKYRADKTESYHQYKRQFGNNWNVAVDTWKAIMDPLTADMMSGKDSIPERYFMNIESRQVSKILGMRNFHNYIKRNFIYGSHVKAGGQLLELAGGRGGALPNWLTLGLSRVTVIDIDESALKEAKIRYQQRVDNYVTIAGQTNKRHDGNSSSRRHDKRLPKFDPRKMEMEAFQLDLTKKIPQSFYKEQLYDANEPNGRRQYDSIVMNFAFHYFMGTSGILGQLIDLVTNHLKVGGRFSMTTFNGERVMAYLQDNHIKESQTLTLYKEDVPVFMLKRLYGMDQIQHHGQEISVMVDSIGAGHTEFLVNIPYVIQRFTKDSKFKLVERCRFGDLYEPYLDEFQHSRFFSKKKMMSEAEIIFSSLNEYLVFERLDDEPGETEIVGKTDMSDDNSDVSVEKDKRKKSKKKSKRKK